MYNILSLLLSAWHQLTTGNKYPIIIVCRKKHCNCVIINGDPARAINFHIILKQKCKDNVETLCFLRNHCSNQMNQKCTMFRMFASKLNYFWTRIVDFLEFSFDLASSGNSLRISIWVTNMWNVDIFLLQKRLSFQQTKVLSLKVRTVERRRPLSFTKSNICAPAKFIISKNNFCLPLWKISKDSSRRGCPWSLSKPRSYLVGPGTSFWVTDMSSGKDASLSSSAAYLFHTGQNIRGD